MTTSTASTTVQAIEQAESAWLVAFTEGEEAMVALMLDDSQFIHGPVGKVDGGKAFAHFAWTRRRAVFTKVEQLSITVRGNTAIATCLQEMHLIFDENLPPFPVQEAVTRVWEETAEGWRLAHQHQSKRMPPA